MKVSQLPGSFGIAIDGVDLARDVSDETVFYLIGLLHEHQILVIRDQQLSDADFVRFGHRWGRPLSFMIKSHTSDAHPEIIRISNSAATPERYRDGAMHWHADSTYEKEPASVTMLYGIESPEVGGETLVASARLAYAALDEETRQRIDPLTGLHCLGGSPALPGEKIPSDADQAALQGVQRHPLVMRHPVTGAKAIFTSGTAFGAEGLEPEEGRDLIDQLRRHITRREFCTSYKVEAGDIFLWDNFQVLHSATPIEYSDEDGKRRLLYRISTKGIPDLCTRWQ